MSTFLNEKRIDALDLAISIHQKMLKDMDKIIDRLENLMNLAETIIRQLPEKENSDQLKKYYEPI